MILLDYIIIAAVVGLFILAFTVYKKKPHRACGGCNGNCALCFCKCEKADNGRA